MAPSTTTTLVVTQEFNAGGVPYAIGDEVDPTVTESWGDGALERRIEHKFVKYVTTPVVPEEVKVPGLVDLLEAKTKSELVEYAATLGLELNADSTKKADMLIAIVTKKAELDAAG